MRTESNPIYKTTGLSSFRSMVSSYFNDYTESPIIFRKKLLRDLSNRTTPEYPRGSWETGVFRLATLDLVGDGQRLNVGDKYVRALTDETDWVSYRRECGGGDYWLGKSLCEDMHPAKTSTTQLLFGAYLYAWCRALAPRPRQDPRICFIDLREFKRPVFFIGYREIPEK